MARRAFYSFHYKPDNWRAAQVRNMGVIEGNLVASDNDWEKTWLLLSYTIKLLSVCAVVPLRSTAIL